MTDPCPETYTVKGAATLYGREPQSVPQTHNATMREDS